MTNKNAKKVEKKLTKKPAALVAIKTKKPAAAAAVVKKPAKKDPPKKTPAKKPMVAQADGKPKKKAKVVEGSFLAEKDAQRCANLGIRTYTLPGDPDDCPHVIEAGGFVTNWRDRPAAKTLALALADFVETQRKEAVREHIEEEVADEEEVAETE